MFPIEWWVCGVLPMVGSWLITAIIFRNAGNMGLLREPNHRSSHVRPTPHGGGLGIAVCGTSAGMWLAWQGKGVPWEIVSLSLVIAAIGMRDDIGHLPVWLRLAAQFLVCSALLWTFSPLPIIQMPAGLSIDGPTLFSLLLLAGVWWINLFNFMDGIDGIAGSQATFMLAAGAALGAWFHAAARGTGPWWWMIALAVASIGFLILNWPPARVFMGDVGSTYLGFMTYALALMSVQAGWLNYSAWLILGAVFVTDTTMTLLIRMTRGERWYEAHCSHAYQTLSRRWGGHRPVTLLSIGINVLWLLPLSVASLIWPRWAFAWTILAYSPLALGSMAVIVQNPGHSLRRDTAPANRNRPGTGEALLHREFSHDEQAKVD